MENLSQLQQQFQNYLLEQNSSVLNHVVETPQMNAELRLAIYKNAYFSRLRDVLAIDFPALHTLLGDEAFDQLAREYIQVYPSNYRSLRWFPNHLVEYLCAAEGYREVPILAEMAAFEWAIISVSDDSESERCSLEQVGLIPAEKWPEMQIIFYPAHRRLNLHWNVVPIWKAVKNEQEPAMPECSEFPIPWFLWRDLSGQVSFESITVDEAWALDAAISGQNFAEMCEGLCEWIDEEHVGMHAAQLLSQWIIKGMVAGIEC